MGLVPCRDFGHVIDPTQSERKEIEMIVAILIMLFGLAALFLGMLGVAIYAEDRERRNAAGRA